MIYVFLGMIFLALVFLPQLWVKHIIAKHSKPRDDFPGTGGELARHLLDEAGLQDVDVELANGGDHYSPMERVVRLSERNLNGKSLSAVAIAAHEVGHAVQHADGFAPLQLRTKIATYVHNIEKIGGFLLLATPVIALVTRAPSIIALELFAGFAILSSSIVFHLVTLPVEFDASFGRALPALKAGKYLDNKDLPAATEVLKAAAYTYVAAALVSLLDVARWLRLLR
jgi:Zn-dependent membrane protease YugP